MFNLGPESVTILMLGGVLLGVMTGYPLAHIVGAVTLIVGYGVFGNQVVDVIYTRLTGQTVNYIFLAVPMFVFMGVMLERSQITERLYDTLYLWLGGLRGGLAITTVLVGTIMAACVGIIAASCTMLALVALPSMIKRGSDIGLASCSVCAGGTLGILIPPSIMLLVYGPMAGISVGKLFFGAFVPGFTLYALYCLYIAIRSFIQPHLAPGVPPQERNVPFLKKTSLILSSLVPPVILVFSVMGVIFFGIAPPTEAAAVGAFVATLLALAYRKLTFKVLKEASIETFKISGFIILIVSMAVAFSAVFIGAGCSQVVEELILGTPGGKWGAFSIIMFIIFILGFVIDWTGIVFIMVPIITPIGTALGFDPVWFAIMICVNLQMAFMTPPFAPAIFFVKGAAPEELGINMTDIIRGVIPFVILIVVGIALCIVFPQLITWLPNQMLTGIK